MTIVKAFVLGTALLSLNGTGAAFPGQRTGVLVATGHIAASGLQGAWRSMTDLDGGRYSTEADLAGRRNADVYDGQVHWRIEASGGSHRLDSPFALRRTKTTGWLLSFGWRQPAFGGAERSAAKMRSDAGGIYSVMTATPRGGEPVELWFDSRSGDLVRSVEQDWFRKVTTQYGDYRSVSGVRRPFTIIRSDGDNEERIAIDGYRVQPDVPAGTFASPRQPDDHAVPAQGTTVPAQVFPQLVIEASVNGQSMHFIFDTGGHSILSPEAARRLGLAPEGVSRSGGSGAGTVAERYTKVREVRIGQAVLRDQAFSVIDLGYGSLERGNQEPISGLLGLEVVERFIARIDYRAGMLTLLPRDQVLACRSGWVPIRFTDDMPTVEANLDGVRAPFTIDTGNNGSIMLYRHWLDRLRNPARYDRGVETVSYGAGGASHNWVSYAGSLELGGGVVQHPMVRTTDDKGGVSLSVSEAGNLGTATPCELYRHSRLWALARLLRLQPWLPSHSL